MRESEFRNEANVVAIGRVHYEAHVASLRLPLLVAPRYVGLSKPTWKARSMASVVRVFAASLCVLEAGRATLLLQTPAGGAGRLNQDAGSR